MAVKNKPGRVLIVQQHLPHYRVAFYGHLREVLAREGISLDLVFDPRTVGNLLPGSLEWALPAPIRWCLGFGWQPVLGPASNADLVIVQQEVKYLASYLLQCKHRRNHRFAFWGHGRNFQARNPNSISERWKRVVSRRADWWFAYNDLSANVVESLGFPPDRITRVQNTIDTTSLSSALGSLSAPDIEAARESLGSTSANIAIFTGGLYPDKRLPFLFEAAKLVRLAVPDFELVVIGRGPDAPLVEAFAAQNPWLHCVGPKNDTEKLPYWALSKLLLMPGLVGLVVCDSFALGVPMVTADYPFHSPEVDYLEDGINGVLVKGWNDPAAYAQEVINLLLDEPRRLKLAAGGAESAKHFTIENMAANFAGGVVSALAHPANAKCGGREG
jgi:glycosyltransferase involved in cell wall biosynthesis